MSLRANTLYTATKVAVRSEWMRPSGATLKTRSALCAPRITPFSHNTIEWISGVPVGIFCVNFAKRIEVDFYHKEIMKIDIYRVV
jgi:hypothetical protein